MSATVGNQLDKGYLEAADTHIRQFGYAGDVSAADAWTALEEQADAVLVDVRTPQEWEQVGIPDLSRFGKAPLRLSWMFLPSREVNERFVAEVSALPITPDTPVFLLCRSGGRSQAAAMALTRAGFRRCYNVAGGFEGADGWKITSLPWKQ